MSYATPSTREQKTKEKAGNKSKRNEAFEDTGEKDAETRTEMVKTINLKIGKRDKNNRGIGAIQARTCSIAMSRGGFLG